MNIGDKIRLLRTNEEGRIIGFKDKNLVEIEIEDGFVVPALRDEVVVISQQEKEYFGQSSSSPNSMQASAPAKKEKNGLQGIFLGFIPINENDISLYIFNFSDKDILYNISEAHGENCRSISHGTVDTGKNSFVTYFKLANFEKWPEIFVQLFFINQQLERRTNSVESALKFKAKSFFNSKRIIPAVEKEGYLIEIKHQSNFNINPAELTNSIYEKTENSSAKPLPKKTGRQLIVDLHVDKIAEMSGLINDNEILDLQLKTFEKELDNAIVSGAASIKFIHGIGNGTLRLRIHKYLSKAGNIKYFEDADKGRFGYGATVAHL